MTSGYCWFDVSIGDEQLKERIIVDLMDDVTPKTCTNFRQLCLGNGGKTVDGTNVPMTYKNSLFHRVISGFMIQGGDFTNHNGTGGASIYGEKFEDENFNVPCDRAGLLAMANAGPHTNGSQFFITTAPATHLTGKHVVFGRVVRGMNSVRAIEHTATGANDTPEKRCRIVDCGVMEALPAVPAPADGDAFPDYVEDCSPPLDEAALLETGEAIRQCGNKLFQASSYPEAVVKYSKAVRYLAAVKKSGENTAVVNEKLGACHNNTAMCLLKMGEYGAARAAATQALQLNPKNSKALFRRGVSAMSSGDPEGAIEDLKAALEIEPENAEIASKLKAAKDLQMAHKEKLAANLKKMFS